MQTVSSTVTLNNGVKMPVFGLGVFESGESTAPAVRCAIKNGYRLIDTAAFYQNEKEVGEGVHTCGIPREEIFVTTKVWNDMQRESRQRESFEKSLRELDMEYVDLYLVHWPIPGKIHETWKVLETLYEEKLVRAIGVSNFLEHHLEELSVRGNVAPAVNQFESHPYLNRKELRNYCLDQGIVPEAWSPLGRGTALEEPLLKELAEKYGKTPAQIILRYHVQNRVVPIPKSVHEERIRQNAEVFDFALEEGEISRIEELDCGDMHGDPDNVDW